MNNLRHIPRARVVPVALGPEPGTVACTAAAAGVAVGTEVGVDTAVGVELGAGTGSHLEACRVVERPREQ